MLKTGTSREFIAHLVNDYEELIRAFSAFQRLAENLNGKFDLADICDEVTRILAEELHLQSCTIMLLDEGGKGFLLQARAGSRYAQTDGLNYRGLDIERDIAEIVTKTGKPFLLQDIDRAPELRRNFSGLKIGSILSIPLIGGGELLGIINMSHPQKEFFHPKQVDLFNILSRVIGQIIAFAKLEQQLSRIVQEKTRELQDSKAYLERLINNANDIILTVTREGRVSFINKKVKELGYIPEEIYGQPYHLYTGERINPVILRTLLRKGRAMWSVNIQDSQGEIREFSCNISLVREPAGKKINFFLVIARDLTEKNKIEKTIATMDRLASLGEMCAGIAHELNNRLVPIISYAELLMKRPLDGKIAKMLASIYNSAMGCGEIIHALLDFARQRSPRKEIISINDVIEKTLSLFNYKLESSGINLIKELCPSLPLTVADPQQIEQVLVNIINNAIQAMEKGGKLIIKTSSDKGIIAISITDTGCGIPENHIDRIFDPFFSTKEIGKGTGLGLSVSYGIIKAHGGEIHVSSREGQGTTFVIELPITLDTTPEKSPSPTSPPEPEPASSNNRKVLIIDDEQNILPVLQEILEMEGFKVDCVSSATEALKMVSEKDYDVILTDIRMPGIDGCQFYRLMAEKSPKLKQRVVFMTGDIVDHELGELKKFIATTGCPYLLKPFSPSELKRIIKQMTGCPCN